MTTKKERDSKDDVVIEPDGKPGTLPAEKVGQRVIQILNDPDTHPIMVIAQAANGDLAVQVFGPPSYESLQLLEQAVEQYRNAVKYKLGM